MTYRGLPAPLAERMFQARLLDILSFIGAGTRPLAMRRANDRIAWPLACSRRCAGRTARPDATNCPTAPASATGSETKPSTSSKPTTPKASTAAGHAAPAKMLANSSPRTNSDASPPTDASTYSEAYRHFQPEAVIDDT